MKKWILGFLVVMIVLIGSLYAFIPNIIRLKSGTVVKATGTGIHRMLLDKANVAKWWPGKMDRDSFYLNDYSYQISNGNITLLPVSITGRSVSVTTSLFIISVLTDSTQLEWVGSMATSYNPIKRFSAYLAAKKINKGMHGILKRMETFYSDPKNIYGFEIKKALVSDSLLIATSGQCKGYPTNQYIYGLIDNLRKYAALHSAKETGFPMLNIATADSINFDVRVAIPTDKLLPSAGSIEQKRMLARGNILVAEVKGGIEITTQAIKQVQHYVHDYQRMSPAIPFCSLITDRVMEPDSSKWITKIYFPII